MTHLILKSNYSILVQLSVTEVSDEEIQEAGQELSTMLGIILETRIRVDNIINRLRD